MIAVLLLAAALAMDAFAVAIAQGAGANAGAATGRGAAWRIAAAFGVAQGLMAFLGWLLGRAFAPVIAAIDHWIAFVLLAFIGVRMIRAGLAPVTAEDVRPLRLSPGALSVAAFATSVDAAAAGLSLEAFALPVPATCAVIAAVTALLCWWGTRAGARLGARFGKSAEILGGVVLVAIGLRILASHLGWLA